jgi:predicted nucleic acid-binding protein
LYLDTNILVFAVEEGNPWTALLRELFAAIDERAIQTFTSELTVAEVLAKPLALGATDLIEKYEVLLSPASLIRVVPVDRTILRAAAELQGQLRIKLADAIHVATAKHSACDCLLTNDERLGTRLDGQIRWLSLKQVMTVPSGENP